jgi:hypothetical protein
MKTELDQELTEAQKTIIGYEQNLESTDTDSEIEEFITDDEIL